MHFILISHLFCRLAFHLHIEGLYLLLAQTYAGDFGVGINHRRNGVVRNALKRNLTKHTPYGHFGLTAGHMREHNLAGHITCCIHIRQIGLHEIVYLDAFSVKLQIGERLQAGEVSTTTYTYENLLCLHHAFCIRFAILIAHLMAFYCLYARINKESDAGLLVFVFHLLHHILVNGHQDIGQCLNHGDFHAQFHIERCKLHANHATTYDSNALRQFFGGKGIG